VIKTHSTPLGSSLIELLFETCKVAMVTIPKNHIEGDEHDWFCNSMFSAKPTQAIASIFMLHR